MAEVPYGAYGQGKVGFPGLGIAEFSLDRVAFSVFGVNIYWYAVMIVIGFVLAVILGLRIRRRTNVSQDNLLDMIIIGTPVGILGARLYYVVMDSGNTYKTFLDVINIRDGGLAIYGGIIAAVATVAVYCAIKKVRALEVLDIVAPCFLLAQGIGRWGNFFNQEAFGRATHVAWRMTIYFGGVQYAVHPTFFYESLWNIIGAVLVYLVFRHRKYLGQAFLCYIGWYGLGRAMIEPLRIDNLYIPGTTVAVSEIIAVACVLAAAVLLVVFAVKKDRIPQFMRIEGNGEDGSSDKR